MGWASGTNYEGRTIGYGHAGVCEHPGCDEKIDLGLGYCCGGLAGVNGEVGCGHYFCSKHLFISGVDRTNDADGGFRCEKCLNETETWWACQECGHEEAIEEKLDEKKCPECGAEMTTDY